MIKTKNNYKSEEIGALLENIDDKITLIAEQHIDLKSGYQKIDKKIDTLTKRADSIVDMVGAIKEDVEVIKIDIEFIKHDLKNKVARDEFAVLERRVALLENRR